MKKSLLFYICFFVAYALLSTKLFSQTPVPVDITHDADKSSSIAYVGNNTYITMKDCQRIGVIPPQYKGFLYFDLSTIPRNSTITSCTIQFKSVNYYGSGYGSILLTDLPYNFQFTPDASGWSSVLTSNNLLGQSTEITNSNQVVSFSGTGSSNAIVKKVQTNLIQDWFTKFGVIEAKSGYGMEFTSLLKVTYIPPIIVAPAAPTNLSTSNISTTGCQLTWTASSGATGYDVYQNGNKLNLGTITNTAATITGLCPGIQYTFYVVAYNTVGASGPSAAVTPTTVAVTGTITGTGLLCDGNSGTYSTSTLQSLNPTSINWSASSPNLSVISGQGTYSSVIKNNGAYASNQVYLYCTLPAFPGCASIKYATFNVWVGPPNVTSISGPSPVKSGVGNSYYAYADYQPGASFTWWTSPATNTRVYPYSGTNMANIYFDVTGGYTVYAKAANVCGQNSAPLGKFVMVTMSGYMSLYPNPASDLVNVELVESPPLSMIDSIGAVSRNTLTVDPTSEKSRTYSLVIANKAGIVCYTATKYTKSFTIPVQNLTNGNYTITIVDGVNKYSSQLTVLH